MLSALSQIETKAPAASLGLKILAGPFAGQEFDLTAAPVHIGRDPGQCQLVIPSSYPGISKLHCRASLSPQKDSVTIEDCGSSNGTYLDSGQPILSGSPSQLKLGDRFYLNDRDVMFEVCVDP
jgi:pSer/pThr/pTyr-binding forkhead associated (FHA) protein